VIILQYNFNMKKIINDNKEKFDNQIKRKLESAGIGKVVLPTRHYVETKNKKLEFNENKLDETTTKRIKLNPEAEEWSKSLTTGGKKAFYILFSKFNYHSVPSIDGSKGITISTDVFSQDLKAFLSGYNDVEKEIYLTRRSIKTAPYTGNIHLNFRFRLFKEEQVQKLFRMFDKKLPTQVLFISKFLQPSNRRRIENPKENLPEFTKTDRKSLEKQREYNLREFGSNVSEIKTVGLVIGKTGEKKYCFFDIIFSLNVEEFGEENIVDIEEGMVVGELSFRFFTKSANNGSNNNEATTGDKLEKEDLEKAQKLEIEDLNKEIPIEEEHEEVPLSGLEKRLLEIGVNPFLPSKDLEEKLRGLSKDAYYRLADYFKTKK
jgi:hypothetical protein